MIEMELNDAVSNYDTLVASLTYSCYRFNRNFSPHITPEEWKKVFGDCVDDMEKIYQMEGK